MNGQLDQVFALIDELKEDSTVPKNIKEKLEVISRILNEDGKDLSIKKDKAIQELSDMTDNTDIQSFVRQDLLSLVSMLEQL